MFQKKSIIAILLGAILAVIVFFIGYQIPRENFVGFICLYMAAFALFYGLWLNKQEWKFWHFFTLAIVLRLILMFAVPELSNDFYRFIWDGELISKGINPYAHTPNELISQPPFYSEQYLRVLYHGMGDLSQGNYSCYPVFNQFLFAIPARFTDTIQGNVIFLKIIILLADIGIIFIGKKILEFLQKPVHLIWLFALNPFVILEFSGNLHFEGVMIFFILLSIYWVLTDKWLIAATALGVAIQVKLIPLILIPFFLKKLRWRRSVGFVAMTFLTVLAIGLILLKPQFWDNFNQSLELYFSSFEFNASVFYIAKAYSIDSVGYDDIKYWGPLLSKIGIVLIGLLAVIKAFKKDEHLFTGMLFAMVLYYAFATTVHPWYISMVLIFSIFTKYKFGLVWSLLIMLSYFAYSNLAFQENMALIRIEYALVFGIMLIEIFRNTSKSDWAIQLNEFFKD